MAYIPRPYGYAKRYVSNYDTPHYIYPSPRPVQAIASPAYLANGLGAAAVGTTTLVVTICVMSLLVLCGVLAAVLTPAILLGPLNSGQTTTTLATTGIAGSLNSGQTTTTLATTGIAGQTTGNAWQTSATTTTIGPVQNIQTAPVFASSVYNSTQYPATNPAKLSYALNGINNTEITNGCAATFQDQNAWWAVDLGHVTMVQVVTVVGALSLNGAPIPSFLTYIANFTVGLTNVSPGTTAPTLGPPPNYSVCAQFNGVPPTATTVLTCSPSTIPGRYLIIQIPTKNFLILCGVQIQGNAVAAG